MKKYLGIIKVYEEHMAGVNIKLLSKTYDNIDLFDLWFDLYPKSEHIILENTKELNSMFKIFKDMTPITNKEKTEYIKVKKLYKEIREEK